MLTYVKRFWVQRFRVQGRVAQQKYHIKKWVNKQQSKAQLRRPVPQK
jgi:hypothetical protein